LDVGIVMNSESGRIEEGVVLTGFKTGSNLFEVKLK
jgi:hypothetical protein